MNSLQSAEYLGFDVAVDRKRGLKQFYEFVRRHGVPKFHRGSTLLFRRIDLDQAVGNAKAMPGPIQAVPPDAAPLRRPA